MIGDLESRSRVRESKDFELEKRKKKNFKKFLEVKER